MSFTILSLAKLTGSKIDGDPEKSIDTVATLKNAEAKHLAFLVNKKYLEDARNTNAGIVVLSRLHWTKLKGNDCPSEGKNDGVLVSGAENVSKKIKSRSYLIHPNPYAAFARIVQHIISAQKESIIFGIHPRATIASTATIAKTASIAPFVTVEDGAIIGENVEIASHCFIGKNVSIGDNSKIFPNVVIYPNCQVGKCCIIHSGAVIGADGFGFAPDFTTSSLDSLGDRLSSPYKPSGMWIKIPQLGAVKIGDDVEIGANTTIDRGSLTDTIIENGVKIDNLVQIAHNCKIGAHTVIAACTGIAGSTTIGRYCMLGGAVGVAGHLTIADRVVVTGKSGVSKSLLKSGVYASTFPAISHKEWNKGVILLRKLEELHKRLKKLEERFVSP